jgi:hypothetical protein
MMEMMMTGVGVLHIPSGEHCTLHGWSAQR